MAIGAEEAYQLARIPTPGGDQALAQLNRNTDRKLATQQWLSEENIANERDKWNKVSDAFKSGVQQYNRAQDRQYQTERDTVADKREDARLKAELERNELESSRVKRLMEDEQRQRDWEMGSEEGQAMSRGDQRRAAELRGALQRPDIEKANADLNAQSVRSAMGLQTAQLRQLEEQNRLAKEDRGVEKASKLYGAAMKAGDQRKVAELDAEFGKELGPQGIQLAKQKAAADASTAQTLSDINIRGTQVGAQAINEVAAANAEATQLNQTVSDALDYIKATPGSAEADVAKEKVLASLPETDREYVRKGSGVGLAGYTLDTSGMSRPQDRMVQTLQKIRGDMEKRVNMLENQYGQLPSQEIKQGIMQLKQSIQKIDMGLSGQKRNNVQLIGGGAAGPSNADFFRGRTPSPQGQALGPIQVQGAPGGGGMAPAPSMRDIQINRQMPAAGAAK